MWYDYDAGVRNGEVAMRKKKQKNVVVDELAVPGQLLLEEYVVHWVAVSNRSWARQYLTLRKLEKI